MDSLEYKTLNKFSPDLVTCIGQSPGDVVDKLRPSGMLAPENISYLETATISDAEKARKIVSVVLNQVQSDTSVYYELVKALKAAGYWTKKTVSKLEEAHTSALVDVKQCSPKETSGKQNAMET